jgi:hypothetical protein
MSTGFHVDGQKCQRAENVSGQKCQRAENINGVQTQLAENSNGMKISTGCKYQRVAKSTG